MRVVAIYSFNGGAEIIKSQYGQKLDEVYQVIKGVDAESLITKQSKENRRNFQMLYDPRSLNKAFKREFAKFNWTPIRVKSDYSTNHYVPDFSPSQHTRGSFREMDFVKERVGVEVQFGKYSFMVYNVAAKMTIFHKLDFIDVGVEIVPVKDMVVRMSSGVSYFEQFVWDLDTRGIADIDIPVIILGITTDATVPNAEVRHLELE